MANDDPSPPPEAPPQGPPGTNAVEPDIVNVGGDDDPDSDGPSGPDDYDADEWDDYWRPLFPYERPYEQQEAMIQEVIQAGSEGGFLAAEGPCGTGKTLAALMGALALIRHPGTKYQRVLCLTSVNQQLRAFEEDLKRINRLRDKDETHAVRGLTLIGKDSVCSYADTGDIEDGAVYSRCESLRDPVKDKLAGKSADQKVKVLKGLTGRARADAGVATEAGRVTQQLAAVDGDTTKWEAPYQKAWPTLTTGSGEDAKPRNFCAFYAQSRLEAIEEEEDGGGSITFNRAETPGVLTPPDVRRIASEEGLCPHMAMMSTVENAEVIVGNYYHAFDPQTVKTFTGSLMDDSTLLVCDEAHDLVPSVRDLLSDSVSLETLGDAADQLRSPLLQVGDPEDQNRTDATRALERSLREQGVEMDDIRALMELFEDTEEWLESRVAEMLSAHFETRGWNRTQHDRLPESARVPLQAPGAAGDYSDRDIPMEGEKWNKDLPFQDDYFSQWARAEHGDVIETAQAVGEAAMVTLDEVSDTHPERIKYDDEHPELSAARKLARWVSEDYTDYYRTVTLEKRESTDHSEDLEWAKHYTVHLELHNCIPSDETAERLSRFGAGTLMSATLAPLETFKEEVGLDRIAEGIDLSETASPVDNVPPRPVREAVYSLRFPEENRLSRAAETPKFTYKQRGRYSPDSPPGSPDPSHHDLTVGFNEVRTQHAAVIESVAATTPGNVLVGMPSYAEGDWAKRVLDASDEVNKPVLLDRSSSDEWTEELKERFFAGDGKVLVTSLRGTLTTGVDYDGDRLKAAVICGVPYPNTQGPVATARKNAYDDSFSSGFEVAFTVPAVRRARQALGRVIRSTDDVGVRVLSDKRYAGNRWADVREHIPEPERGEYKPTSNDRAPLKTALTQFWRSHDEI